MDPNLHQKQGIHHLQRVLNYAPFVVEDKLATVYLTHEDWMVVADTLFNMDTPKEMLPESIQKFALVKEDSVIELETPDHVIEIEMM